MRPVVRMVRSRLEPPAPYVTETKAGSRGSRSRMVRQRVASPSSSLGGQNSAENVGTPRWIRSVTVAIRRPYGDTVSARRSLVTGTARSAGSAVRTYARFRPRHPPGGKSAHDGRRSVDDGRHLA